LDGPAIYVPSAFAPDGINKTFKPIPVGIAKLNYFRIFNRYGEKVFETSKWFYGWDGIYKAKKQPLGAYIWVLSANDINGRSIDMKGSVLMIR
jgi:hypothetical protein